ncbi:MAG: hypothetical protein WBP26_00890 [Candidatus Saccharimonadales bacterium]
MNKQKLLVGIAWLRCSVVIVLLLVVLAPSAAVTAQNNEAEKKATDDTSKTAQAIGSAIQSYQSDLTLQRGLLVRLDSKDSKKVRPVNAKDMQDTFGVVVSPNDTPISVGVSESSGDLAYVATSGNYNVIVTDQAGQIKKDDLLTISALDGIAMKAGENESTVVGKALTNFDGKTNITGKVTLKDSKGNALQTVQLGMIPVAFEVGSNPLQKSTRADLPEWLIRTGLVDKDVQPVKIYISIGILALAIIVALTVLYAGIRHSMISIGRNPLSRGSIARNLLSIFLSAFIILIIGSFTVYLILKL